MTECKLYQYIIKIFSGTLPETPQLFFYEQ